MIAPKGPQRLRAQSQGCRSVAGSTFEIFDAARAPSISEDSILCSAFKTFCLSRGLDPNSAQLHSFWIPAPENTPKAKLSGISRVLQASHNKLMHAYNGNPFPIQLDGNLCLPKIQLQLYDLLSPPDSSSLGSGTVPISPKMLSLSQLLPIHENVYTRDFLLGCRPLTPGKEFSFGFLTQTTTHFTGSASQTQRRSRTGRRIQFHNSSGQHVLYK